LADIFPVIPIINPKNISNKRAVIKDAKGFLILKSYSLMANERDSLI